MLNIRRIMDSPTIATWMSLAIRIGGLSVLLPLVLTHLDVNEVLVWQMLSSVTMMILWIDFGFSPTFSRIIALTRGGGTLADLRGKRQPLGKAGTTDVQERLDLGQVIGTQRFIYVWLSVVGAIIAAIVGTAALFRPVSALDTPSVGWLAWGMTAVSSLLALYNGSNGAVLVGLNEVTLARRLESVVGFMQISTTCLVVLATSNLALIAASYSFWSLVSAAVFGRVARRQLRLHGMSEVSTSRAVLSVVWPAAWRSGIGILLSTGVIQLSGLVMPQLAPATEAAAYLLALRLITTVSQLSQAPFYSKLPAMATANAKGQREAVVGMAARGMVLALWTMVVGTIGLVVIAPPILKLIGSSVHLPAPDLMIILGIAFFAERYGAMHMQIYTLSNHVIWHIVNGATGTVMLVAFAALWPLVGPKAMPLAMLVAYGGFLCWYVSGKSLRFLSIGRWHFESQTTLWPLAALAACTVLALVRA